MRGSNNHFLRICRDHFSFLEPIYEFGALQVTGHPREDIRGMFEGKHFIGADMREGPGVDVVLNLHDLDLEDGSAGTVVCLDTLEHVEYPRRAMEEIYRVLADDGIAVISSVFEFPIHGYPNDFWRFTPEGFRSLLNVFENSFVGSFGVSEDVPRTVVGVGFKGDLPDMTQFTPAYENWSTWYSGIMQKIAEEDLQAKLDALKD